MSKAIDLVILKIFGATTLAVASLFGVYVPVRLRHAAPTQHNRHGNKEQQQQQHAGTTNTTRNNSNATAMHAMNTLSAGLLLGMSLMHFFVHCVVGFIARYNSGVGDDDSDGTCSSSSCSSSNAAGAASLESAIVAATSVFIAGILLPLLVDKVIVVKKFHNNQQQQQQQQQQSDFGHSHISIDDMAATSDEFSQQQQQQHQRSTTMLLVLAMLLSIHSFMEGGALGVEDSIPSLRAAMLPMIIHKFFDGFVLGVSFSQTAIAARVLAATSTVSGGGSPNLTLLGVDHITPNAATPATSATADSVHHSQQQLPPSPPPQAQVSCATAMLRLLRSKTVLVFCLVTPLAMVLTAMLPQHSASSSSASSLGKHDQHGAHHAAAHDHGSSVPSLLVVLLQGAGAGSLLYVALMEILPQEFPSHHHHHQQQHHSAQTEPPATSPVVSGLRVAEIGNDPLAKFVILCVGIWIVVALEGMHEH